MIFDSVKVSNNLSLYSIPAAYFTVMYPHILKSRAIRTLTGKFNNVHPRDNTTEFTQNNSVPQELARKIKRMEGAHNNGLEMFPLWTAAILAANYAGFDNEYMNKMSLGLILYNQIYIAQTSNAVGFFRTAVWLGALSIPLTLLFKGAAKVAAQ